jgi:hypothetical protein
MRFAVRLAALGTIDMSATTESFLQGMLQREENIVKAIELQLVSDTDVTLEQRQTLLRLQLGSEVRCDELRSAISEHR